MARRLLYTATMSKLDVIALRLCRTAVYDQLFAIVIVVAMLACCTALL